MDYQNAGVENKKSTEMDRIINGLSEQLDRMAKNNERLKRIG